MMPTSHVTDAASLAELPSVNAVVKFCQRVPRALQNVVDPSQNFMPLVDREITIHDARPIRDQLDLEVQGFGLYDHTSTVSHLRDPKALDRTYHAEVCEFVKQVTKADYVLPFRDYCQVRLSTRALGENGNETTRPSGYVHADITQDTFENLTQWVQQDEGIAIPSYSRACLYGTWRAVSLPPHDFPLTLCDARTHKTGNYVVMDNVTSLDKEDRKVETRLDIYDPDEHFYYFSKMTSEELLLFAVYDSKFNDGLTVMHTSFDNTKKWPDAAPRESIEARLVAFWK
jgi:hypothetical protein